MRKKILFMLLFLVLLALGAYLYVNLYFLPVQLKKIVATIAQEYLHREVRAGKIFFQPIKGVVVRDLFIFEKNSRDQVFLRVDEVSFNVFLPAILKNRNIIIPSLTLVKPKVSLIKTGPGQWNVSDLLRHPSQGQASGPFSFFLGGVAIKNGSCRISDGSPAPAFAESWTDLYLRLQLSISKNIDFQANAQNPRTGSLIKVKGRFFLSTKDTLLEAAVKNIDLPKYIAMFDIQPKWEIKAGFIEGAVVKWQTADRQMTDLSGKIQAKTDLVLSPEKHIKGTLRADGVEIKNRSGRYTVRADAFSARDAKLLFDGFTLTQGDISAQQFKLVVGPGEFLFQGPWQMSQTDLTWKNVNRFQGNAVAENFFCHKKNSQFRLKGDLLSDQAAWAWENRVDLSGPLSAKSILINQDDNSWKVTGQVESSALLLRVADQMSFSGKIQTTPVTFTSQDDKMTMKSAFDITDAEIVLKKENKLTGTLRVKDLSWSRDDGKNHIQALVDSDQVRIMLAGEREFTGSPDLKLRMNIDPQAEQPLSYSGTVVLTDSAVTGIPRVGRLDHIQGQINIRTEEFQTDKITFEALGKAITLSGLLRGLNQPYLDIKVGAQNSDLQTFQPFWSDLSNHYPLTATGTVDWQLSYQGSLAAFDQAKVNLRAELKDAAFTSPRFPAPLPSTLTKVNGLIRYNNRELSWQDLQADLKNRQVILNGKFRNLTPQVLETTLLSDGIDLYTRASIDQNRVDLKTLEGTFLNSRINVNGGITLRDKDTPLLDLSGDGDVEIENLTRLHPALAKYFSELKPTGELAIDGTFRGDPQNWPQAIMDIRVQCPRLTVKKLRIDNTSLLIKNDATATGRMEARGDFYGGEITMNSSFDSVAPSQPFTLKAQIINTDLAQLRKDSDMKKKELYGTLSLNVDAQGSLKIPEQLTGEGVLTVKDGYIWELSLLRGIWKVLFIPEFDKIVFTDALAHFDIAEQRATTNDLYLTGTTADLKGHGWIGFDNKIDLTIVPKFKATEIVNSIQSKILPKFPSGMLAETEGYIQIKISGTLDKPSYTVATLPTKVLKNTTNAIFDGVKGILDDIIP